MFASRPLKAGLVAVLLSMPLLAHADAAQEAGAKELAATLNLDNMLPDLAQRTSASAVPLLQEYFVKNKIQLSEAQQKKVQAGLKGYGDNIHKLAADYFGSASVKTQFEQTVVKNFSAQFSADELKQINAFYKSAAGQKFMKQQPQIINGIAGETLKTAEKTLLPKMQAAAEAYGKTIAKK
ncbi:DUF2059 domain-containing protein [Chromobacterium amazonense]|uniref:DUF2059 domain-containing protein n=1 Tax=Chromobacterium amazonense TaxID=1382803 RepID=A0ABU8V0Y7_9NEIS|nr:DUF2059 domain-containing protein [Chromobacterium amazonense]MBM2885728.1 DUF2059 domain-containing protein [Chromobacterium amazonense]MDE1713923.1 DUF2059 domain-containing protein [Chromobacterium amazonense]MDQ4541629.1 DUF2059 domain-containing protein [Chromobacterium amazonense]